MRAQYRSPDWAQLYKPESGSDSSDKTYPDPSFMKNRIRNPTQYTGFHLIQTIPIGHSPIRIGITSPKAKYLN